jgi:hypothetical protein
MSDVPEEAADRRKVYVIPTEFNALLAGNGHVVGLGKLCRNSSDAPRNNRVLESARIKPFRIWTTRQPVR